MKIAVVSACFGIDLKIPDVINDENTDYHLFTDQDININNQGWAIHKINLTLPLKNLIQDGLLKFLKFCQSIFYQITIFIFGMISHIN